MDSAPLVQCPFNHNGVRSHESRQLNWIARCAQNAHEVKTCHLLHTPWKHVLRVKHISEACLCARWAIIFPPTRDLAACMLLQMSICPEKWGRQKSYGRLEHISFCFLSEMKPLQQAKHDTVSRFQARGTQTWLWSVFCSSPAHSHLQRNRRLPDLFHHSCSSLNSGKTNSQAKVQMPAQFFFKACFCFSREWVCNLREW